MEPCQTRKDMDTMKRSSEQVSDSLIVVLGGKSGREQLAVKLYHGNECTRTLAEPQIGRKASGSESSLDACGAGASDACQ